MATETGWILRNVGHRTIKRLRGVFRSLFRRNAVYDDRDYWDREFYSSIDGDQQTIARSTGSLTAAYHYASLEAAVVRALARGARQQAHGLLDVGSGAGHWIEFFLHLFPMIGHVDACDVSDKSCRFLTRRYADNPRVRIHNCAAEEVPGESTYDLVCMLGCAFHIVDDANLASVLKRIWRVLDPGGVIVLNDLLPLVTYANQFTRAGGVYKVVRSKRRWRKLAANCGLEPRFARNFAWIRSPGPIPEGHVVCLQKPDRS